jgi:hypothetical protein
LALACASPAAGLQPPSSSVEVINSAAAQLAVRRRVEYRVIVVSLVDGVNGVVGK